MFAKFDKIPSLPGTAVQDIKEKLKCRGQRITKGNNSNRIGPYFSIVNVHLVDINVFAKLYEIPSLPFQDIENQNVVDGRTDERTDGLTDGQRENSIPPTNTVCGGITMVKSRWSVNLTTLFLGRLGPKS